MQNTLFRRPLRWVLILTLLLTGWNALPAGPVQATDSFSPPDRPAPALADGTGGPIVTTAVDENDGSCADGDCSLRDALILAANGDTITFARAFYITLRSQLTISKTLTLDARGRAVTLNGNLVTRIFYIQATGVVTFNQLKLINARTYEGAAINNDGGTVTVLNSVISDNQSYSRGSGILNSSGNLTVRYSTFNANVEDPTFPSNLTGSGIWNSGALTVTHSTFAGNISYHPGGGIYNAGTALIQNSTFSNNAASRGGDAAGGAIYNALTLTVQNSTFYGNRSGNSATNGRGGALYNAGTATLQNSTLASNGTDQQGGNLYNAGTLSLYNTILAQSTRGGDCVNAGTLAVNDHNLIMDNSCSPMLNGDPLLGALANNGGSTQTMLPQTGSPAIDNGSAACLSLDQRDYGRFNSCDIGAVETDMVTPEATLLNNEIVIVDGDATPTPIDGTDFGNVVIGEALTHTFTISNSGPMTLSVSNFTLSGTGAGDFNVIGLPLPTQIPPISTVTFQVIFSPLAEGTRAVTLTLVNNDPDETFYDFALQGAGLSPDIAVLNNSSVITDGDTTPDIADGTDFGSLPGGQSLTHTFTISNSGIAPLYLTGMPFVRFIGPAAADFTLVVSPTTPIAPGETTTFQVRYAPTALGTQTATLILLNADPDETLYDFVLQGTAPCWFATDVQNTNDSGAGSLRQLLTEACPNTTLEFAPGLAGQTLALTSTELSITQTVTIANPRAPGLVLSGNNARRLFTIQPGGVLTLSQLTLSNGKVSGGAGCPTYCGGSIYNAGTLTVLSSTLSRNTADFWGGAVYNTGTLQIQASTFATNSVSLAGNGGGIYNAGALTALNSTFSSNIGGYFGGGGGLYNDGSATVQQSTFSGNLAGTGGGLINATGRTLALTNTLLANNPLGGDCRNDGNITTNDHNLIEDGSCNAEFTGDPLLGPLTDNGGSTWTHALLYGSRAVDAGTDTACPAVDQRGSPRPGPLTSRCDIGAFERQNVQPDMTVALKVIPAAALPGAAVTYTLAFSNTGDGAATGIVITATLPVSVTNVNLSSSGVPITMTGIPYVLSAADLLPGAGGLITFTGVLSKPLPAGTLNAAADIAAQPADRNPNNNTAAVSFTVLADNVAPLAVNDLYTTPQDSALVVAAPGILSNDLDADLLTAAPAAAPGHGTVAVQANGGLLYLPTAGFTGTDSFTYLVSDGALTATGRVTVNVTPVNHPVTARDDIAVMREDAALVVAAPGVLANDTDPDGGGLTAGLFTVPFTGNLTLAANGAYTFTPPPDFNDVVSFTYHVRDTGNLSATATVYILVQAVNDAPVFVIGANQVVSSGMRVVPGWATGISAGPANERSQTLAFNLTTPQSALFAVQPTVDVSGTLRYTPAAGAAGVATVTVTLRDNGGTALGGVDTSQPQTFTITLQPGYQLYLPLVLRNQH